MSMLKIPTDADALRRQMPQVGDRLKLVPTLHKGMNWRVPKPMPCVVIYTHPEHLWYMVQFENGLRECYKATGRD